MMKQRVLHSVWVLVLCSVPSFAIAQSESEQTATGAPSEEPAASSEAKEQSTSKVERGFDGRILTEAEKKPRLLRLRAGVTQMVGQGTFNSGFGRNTSVVSAFNVQPAMDFKGWTLYANTFATLEYTDPDNAVGRRFTLFDPTIGARMPVKLSAINSMAFLSGGVRLPLSPISRGQGSIGSAFVSGLGIWQSPLDGLSVRLGLGVQGNAALKSLRTVDGDSEYDDRSYGTVRTASCQTRSGESSADACGAIPSVATLRGSLGVGYVTGDFSFDVDFAVLSFVSAYRGPDDEFRSDNARAGVNASTLSSGSVSATYTVTPWLAVSGGISSLQPIQQADGSGMRFPFWNFSGAANNFSSAFVSTAFRY